MEFKDKKVIVTGASRSIGRKIALNFAEQGADLVISYHSDAEGAEETIKAIKDTGRVAQAFCADFTQTEEVAFFAKQAIDYLGHIDILINNSGMLCRETLFELSPEKMQQVFQVNTVSPFYLTQICSQQMIENKIEGSIINISSIIGNVSMPTSVGYGASKAALNKWTKHAALNLAQYNIRINAVAPGVIEAGMNEDTAVSNPELWEYYISNIPLNRPGKPDDIANFVLFLASKKAEWITGKIFEIDGGYAI